MNENIENIELEDNYGAGNIKVLKGLEAVRKRPGMYIGDTNENGLHHMVYEVVDNSIDEAMAGFCDTIKVTITKTNGIIVSDNARGIPTDIHPDENISAATVALTVLHAGGKFDKDTYQVSGGLHGVGVSVVNALSSSLKMTIYRDNKIHYQEFHEGLYDKPLEIIGETKKTGTTIEFQPDLTIFEVGEYSFEILSKRFREVAYLNPKITIELTDKREGKQRKEIYHFEGGIKQFVEDSNKAKPITDSISFSAKEDGVEVDIALIYNDTYTSNVKSFVNNIHTIDGGTHEAGFRDGLTRSIRNYLKANANAKDRDAKLDGNDTREGLVAVVSVRVPEPQFEGQTKGKLGSSYVKPICQKLTYEMLSKYLEENPVQAKLVMEKSLMAARGREAAKKARELTRKTDSMTVGTLPGKLTGCNSKDPEIAELYLVEGDSAGGSAKQGRNKENQAILPLKGKILNVEKSRLDKILKSDEIKNMITAIGCGIGEDFSEDKIRYHKIIIMTDADVDGSHIQTLLLTFFFRFLKPVIEKGYLYIAQPPLYLYRKGKGKDKVEVYLKDDAHLSNFLIENGLGNFTFDSMGYNDLLDMFKIVSGYRAMLQNLEKRYSLVEVIKYIIENDDLVGLENDKLFLEIEKFLAIKNYNILSKNIDDESIHLFVQTNEGLEELIIDDDLLASPYFAEASYLYKKINQRDLSTFKGQDLIELLEEIEASAKDKAYIQRYKGLGEMNPDQLWETTMDEEARSLLRVTIDDAQSASETFTLFMGDEVEPRRKYIEEHAKDVKHLDV
jgi:DNA gyrase subunit B